MWLGFRFGRVGYVPNVLCRNPDCNELLPWDRRPRRWELCPSCRFAYGRGALLAGVVGALVTVLAKLLG